jgi:excisionase family DNA binding protein
MLHSMTEETLLTRAQVAERLQVHPRTVDRWVRAGELPFVTLGPSKRRRFRPSDVAKMIKYPTDAEITEQMRGTL